MTAKRTPADARLDLIQGTLDMLVLKTLVWGPTHGHGIATAIERMSAELRIDHGSLYPALQRLQQEGWIVAEWGTSENNRKAKFYAITRSGRKQLTAQARNWERISAVMMRMLRLAPR
jgi:transcriptional regulator